MAFISGRSCNHGGTAKHLEHFFKLFEAPVHDYSKSEQRPRNVLHVIAMERTTPSYGLLLSLLFCLLSCVSARPEPKYAWARERLHKGLVKSASLKPRWANYTTSELASSCAEALAANASAPNSDYEAASVAKWLFGQTELNLTASEDAGSWDNAVLLIELMQPNKSEVIPYIDGDATAPARYAHVVLDNMATDEPHYADILVGPLPVQNGTTTWQPLEYPYTKQAGGKVRNLDADHDLLSEWRYNVSATVSDITLDLWGGTALGLDNDTLDIWGLDPYTQEDGRITSWVTYWNYQTDDFDAETLLPLGLFFKCDLTGRDSSQWKLEGWLYNDIYYPTTESFRAAYYSPGFVKLKANVEGDWARTDQQGPIPPLDTAYPPTAVAPTGSRYKVDVEHKYVEWMDFSFYVSFSRDTGMALHDIKYKGQRILYELGLQEALAHYAGNDPVQSGTSYLDSYYGFGPYAFELVKGYDCPAYATYLNTTFYVAETTHTHLNSLCLYEFETDYAIQRHSTSSYVSVTKNIQFSIRSVCTVGVSLTISVILPSN